MRVPILVLDFDGTVCLGDGPIWAYADRLLPLLSAGTARAVRGALAAYLADPGSVPDYPDGYTALADLALPHVDADTLRAAYLDSRRALAAPDIDIHAPDGLADLLAGLAGRIRAVVLTNAPRTGLEQALTRLGLAEHIDTVMHDAGKPARAAEMLAALLAGASPESLMSVGDLWVNDIAPALEMGCATALIDRTGAERRPAHARASTIAELYPAIREWSADPARFAAGHDPNRSTTVPSILDGSAP